MSVGIKIEFSAIFFFLMFKMKVQIENIKIARHKITENIPWSNFETTGITKYLEIIPSKNM